MCWQSLRCTIMREELAWCPVSTPHGLCKEGAGQSHQNAPSLRLFSFYFGVQQLGKGLPRCQGGRGLLSGLYLDKSAGGRDEIEEEKQLVEQGRG